MVGVQGGGAGELCSRLLTPPKPYTASSLFLDEAPVCQHNLGPQGRQEKYCLAFQLFSNYFSGSSEDAQRLMKDQ
eukprot:superscaffoldBa00000064_g1047